MLFENKCDSLYARLSFLTYWIINMNKRNYVELTPNKEQHNNTD